MEKLKQNCENIPIVSDPNISPKRYSYKKLLGNIHCCLPW